MKPEYVDPFIDSANAFFGTMLKAACQKAETRLDGAEEPKEIMAIIGLGGPARGTVSLLFPVSTALNVASRLLGTEISVVDETVSDVVAETVNIVAGAAKARLSAVTGSTVDLSLPAVVRGSGYSVDYPSKAASVEVPFLSDLGPFSMRISLEVNKQRP